MTPKERSVWMMSIYSSQFRDYMITTGFTKDAENKWVRTSEPELTSEQKDILRDKKKLLTEVYPAIKMYTGYAESGVLPDVELETMIVSKLNQLMMDLAN